MSSEGGGSRKTRGFGDFSSSASASASSLFDAAFSKSSAPKKRFPRTVIGPRPIIPPPAVDDAPVNEPIYAQGSPQQVFSPPISLPESSSTEGATEIDNNLECSDDDEDTNDSPGPSFKRKFNDLSSNVVERSRNPTINKLTTLSTTGTRSSSFDFEEDEPIQETQPKKRRDDPLSSPESNSKFSMRTQKPAYKLKWNEDEDEEDEEVSPKETVRLPERKIPIYAREKSSRVKNVKDAHQCLESGEHDDFKQDLEYILSTLKGESSCNVKCLSSLSLAKKCISSEFRQFVRSEGQVNIIFKTMVEAPTDECFSLCAATIVYLMCRDFVSIPFDAHSIRLMAQLLQCEVTEPSPERPKYQKMVWDIFQSYLQRMESAGKRVQFDLTEKTLDTSPLVLEALVFVVAKNVEEGLKTELLNLGVLQWIVRKVEKVVNQMAEGTDDLELLSLNLMYLERCFRILEACTLFHKKNQAFLISHRASILIQTCGRLLPIIHSTVVKYAENAHLVKSFMGSLALMARVLINMSHENELCSTKLGQVPNFLTLCLTSGTYLARKYADNDKKFDIYVMYFSLLVNLVERCNSNRRKVIETTVKVCFDDGTETEEVGLVALAKLFCLHEAKAKLTDDELDKELAFEEAPDENEEEEDDETTTDGRLDRGKIDDLSEFEMLDIVQKAMSKASTHMEDSVAASYIALLVGCLLQQNEDHVTEVKEVLPEQSFVPLMDQLNRFLEFMKMTTSRTSGCRSVEKIIDLLEKLN